MATHPSGAPCRDPGPDRLGPRLFAHRGRRTVSSAVDLGPAGVSATEATLVRDKNLLDRWQAGDAEAGVTLLDHYSGYVRRVALRLGVSGGDFEEFWQDLVLRLVQQLPRLHERLRTSFAGYLAWQARDLVRTWRRRARAIAPPPGEPVARAGDANGSAAAFWHALADCSGRLPPREQQVFEHRFLGGLDLAAVALHVGSNANAVAQAVFRLVRRLRDCLTQKGFEGPGDVS